MKAIETEFPRLVLRFRLWVILACLAAVLAAASGGRHLAFTTNYRVFFSSENPQLLAFEALERTYQKNDNVMFVLAPAGGDVFTRPVLDAVRWLTEQAWQVPYSTRVDSLANFQHTEAEGDDLVVRDLIGAEDPLDPAGLERIREVATTEPLLAGRLVSGRGHVTAVNVTVQLPGLDEAAETPEAVAFSRALAEEFERLHPDIDVYLTGMILMNNSFSEASKLDMQTLVPASFAVMLVALALLIRGWTGALGTLLVIALSIVGAMGLGGYAGFPISPPSATAPIIILTVAIANCVHVLVTYLQALRAGAARHAALEESLRQNLQPVFLASFTTALGFLSMNFSDAPPFGHLGNFVAFGVGISFVLSVTFLPALLSYLPGRAAPARSAASEQVDAFDRLGDFVVRRHRALRWGGLAVVIALIAAIPRNELNDVFVNYFDETVDFRRASDFTTENLTGLYLIEYSLESGEPGGISEPAYLADVAAFAEWFRDQPETKHVNVLTDVMLRLNRNMHGDDDAAYRLPESRELAAQYLLLYEMSLPYGLDLNNQINVDKSATRMSVSIETLSSNEVLALEARAAAWLDANAPSIRDADATGTTLMFANIGKRNIVSMLIGTTVALVLISLVLVFALRSLRIGLTSMVPNLVPAAMGFGLWGLLVGEVGLALSVVSGMTLGIVVDDTVHFLSKYLRARRESGLSPPEAVRYAFHTVGRALAVTSAVLIAGFLVLSRSSFEINAGMGLLTAIVIGLALLADFLLLPPLLMKLEESDHAQVAGAGTAANPASA